jgi:hypothetical protein
MMIHRNQCMATFAVSAFLPRFCAKGPDIHAGDG